MKTLERCRPSEAQQIKDEKEISNVTKKWWRGGSSLEVFPKGFIPVFFTFFAGECHMIEDDNICFVPKSAAYVEEKSEGGYICARYEKAEEAVNKYASYKKWIKVEWDGCNFF